MHERTFDPARLERLNDPARLTARDPDTLWRAAALEDPRTVVDLGAGTGVFAFEFARRMSGGTVYAVDTQPEMLDWLEANVPDDLQADIETVVSTEDSIPLGDALADLVIMIDLYHEIADPEQLLIEAARILAPGGRLVLADWKRAETPQGPPLDQRVAPELIAGTVADAGFASIEADTTTLPMHTLLTATRP